MREASYKMGPSPRSSPYARPGAIRIYNGFNRQSRSLHAPSSAVMKGDPWMPAMMERQSEQLVHDPFPKDPWMPAIMAMDKVGQQFALRAPSYLYDAVCKQSDGYSELYHIPPVLETQMWETYFALPPAQPTPATTPVHIISIPDSPAAILIICEDLDQVPVHAMTRTPERSPPPLPLKIAEPRPRRFSERIRARERSLTTTRHVPYPSPQPDKIKGLESSVLIRKTRSRSLKIDSDHRSDTTDRRNSHPSSRKCSFDLEKNGPCKRHASRTCGKQRRFQCVACADGVKYKTLRGLQQHILHFTPQRDCLSSGLYAEFDFDDSQTWKVKTVPRAWTRAASVGSMP